jgi:hypothetical protein
MDSDSLKVRVFVSVSHFHPSLIYPVKSWRPPEWSPLLDALKCITRVEVTDSGKHSILLRYGRKGYLLQASDLTKPSVSLF